MNEYLEEIKKALDNKLYLIALQSCLIIPDICSALQANNGKTSGNKYKKWYQKYFKNVYDYNLEPEDCYLFRCSMIHQGKTIPTPQDNQEAMYSRIIFLYPNQTICMHNNIFNDVLNLDLVTFCNDIIKSAESWNKELIKTNNKNYLKNADNLIAIHLNGIEPYICGFPVIG